MKTYNMEELVGKITSASADDVTKANEIMQAIINRAIRFDGAQYKDVLLDTLTDNKSSLLLFRVASIVSLYKTVNFFVNKDSLKQGYVNLENSSFSMLGDTAYNSRITSPLSHELVWTDQDIDGTRQIIPILKGISADTIDFVVDTLYSHMRKDDKNEK